MAKGAKNKDKEVKSKKEKKSFFKGVKAELKKVIWPTPKQLFSNTMAVIVYALIVGVIVFVLDICFEKMNEFGIEKLKTLVKSSEQNIEENSINVENTNSQNNVEESTNGSNTENIVK